MTGRNPYNQIGPKGPFAVPPASSPPAAATAGGILLMGGNHFMSELILEARGPVDVEKIAAAIRSFKCKATIHHTGSVTRLVLPFDVDLDKKDHGRLAHVVTELVETYFRVPLDPKAIESGSTVEINGEPWKVDDVLDPAPKDQKDQDKGPEVPSGIRVMSEGDCKSIGEVQPAEPAGMIAPYLSDRISGLDRLAGVIGQIVVRQNDGFWVRGRSGAWSTTTQTLQAAIGRVKTEWRDELYVHGVRASSKHIEEVFRRSLLPVVSGTLTSPVKSDFVMFEDQVYLNLGLAPRLPPVKLAEDGIALRTFILSNVLNDHRDFSQIDAELKNRKAKTPTRWALNWIAHLYQRPGVAMSTALWLISVQQGIGKTLTGDILAELVGLRNTARADQAEMTGEWSDWLVGRSLIIADEVNVVEKKSFYARQKTWIGSRAISVRKRGVGTWTIPTIANWLYTTNDLQPIRIDGADRRNMLIASTNDLDAAMAVIDRIKPILEDRVRFRNAVAELGSWLDSIDIDDGLIRRAITTELKEDLIESTRDAVDSFVLEQAERGSWKRDQFITTDDLMKRYTAWCDRTEAFRGLRSQTHLVNGLKKLKARDWVIDKRTMHARGWMLTNPPMPAAEVVSHVDFFKPEMGKVSMLEEMRARFKKEGYPRTSRNPASLALLIDTRPSR